MITNLGQYSVSFLIGIVICLKIFKCSLYVIFYIKSKQSASINKRGVLELTFLKNLCVY